MTHAASTAFSKDAIGHAAQGRWRNILTAAGIAPEYLQNRHGPCPFCGGTDRWRWDDRAGRGTGFCAHCLPGGDGFAILARQMGLNTRTQFRTLLATVSKILGTLRHVSTPQEGTPLFVHTEKPTHADTQRTMQALNALKNRWNTAVPLTDPKAGPARQYLRLRGLEAVLDQPLEDVRFHGKLGYYHDGKRTGYHPALLCKVRAPHGSTVTIQRIYLSTDGRKAAVPGSVKKVMRTLYPGAMRHAAIRLYPVPQNATLAVSEGLETALAVHITTHLPVWCCMSAGGLASLVLPQEVRTIQIWGDLDRSGSGQQAAARLAKRLTHEGRSVAVKLPEGRFPEGGKSLDWLDILNGEVRKKSGGGGAQMPPPGNGRNNPHDRSP